MLSLSTEALRRGAVTLAALSLAACATPTAPVPAPERIPTMTASPSQTPDLVPPATGTAIVVTIGETTVPGRLADNPAARDLAAQLPLTLSFADYNSVEKIARLDSPLSMDGMPAGDDPDPGDIGWFAPSSSLVLYYGDVGYWRGIARLGTFDRAGIELLADGPHEVAVTIATAD